MPSLSTVICSNVSKKNLWKNGTAKIVILLGFHTVLFANIMPKFTKELPIYAIFAEFMLSPSIHFHYTWNLFMIKSRISRVTIVMRLVCFLNLKKVTDGGNRNPGFGFWKCHGEMGSKGKLDMAFLHFLPYLMIFQSGLVRRQKKWRKSLFLNLPKAHFSADYMCVYPIRQ